VIYVVHFDFIHEDVALKVWCNNV